MLANYFKIAIRNILRHKGYSAVNILGLSIGIACVTIIALLIKYETGFDKFHIKKDRIFRVFIEENAGGNITSNAPVMLPFAPAAKTDIPEIEDAVRVSEKNVLLAYNDKKFYERVYYVDEKFFNVFTFHFASGDQRSALKEPNTAVISQKFAGKYFGNENPVGKSFLFNNKDIFLVTGVIKDIPDNSHIKGDIFASFTTFNEKNTPRLNDWGSFSNDYTYLLLRPNVNSSIVESKLNSVIVSRTEKEYFEKYNMRMQPLEDIHFSDLAYDYARTTPVVTLYMFGVIALFILLIAAINFINLTTARFSHRNKEIGIRKVVGANRIQLIKQFLSESFVMTIISFIVGIALSTVFLIQLNKFLDQNYSLSLLFNKDFAWILISILLLTSLLAGFYPAFVLSKPVPQVILKKNVVKKRGYSLRASLVVMQFAISTFLITCTITVFNQTNYLLSRNLGFPSEKILVLNNNDPALIKNGEAFKNALLRNSNIKLAAFSSGTPGSPRSSKSDFTPEGSNGTDEVALQILDVDYDFLKTYDLKMVSGRFFSPAFTADTSDAYIINEAAAKKLKFTNPLQKRITHGSGEDKDSKYCRIIGVMENFNYRSLVRAVDPIVFRLKPSGGNHLSLQLNENDIASTMDFIKETAAAYSPAYPFDYFFIKARFERYYTNVKRLGTLLGVFSILAVIISSIGILGLVSFSTEQKSKEIGIIKVLGASVPGIAVRLCKEFVKWVLISNIIAWPLAYMAMTKWLNGFAYRIDFGFIVLAVTLIISIFITIISVSFHAVKAATANPVDSLKSE